MGSNGWTEHRTREGYSYYYNAGTSDGQWELPEGFISGQTTDLSREEIQVWGRRLLVHTLWE